MTAPDYGAAFALWRAGAAGDWARYTRHAFVEALGDGSLPRASFLHYLRQDYVFLIHFARAWALAAAKADTLDEMAAATATAHALIHDEMPLHVRTCAALGVDEAALAATPETPENLAYTRYVLEAGYSGDFLDLMAALAPCVLGYGEIGRWLTGPGGPLADGAATRFEADAACSEWAAAYGGGDYQALCRDVGGLIDSALTRRLGQGWSALPRADALQARFTTATRLEIGFWDMASRPEPR